MLKRNKLAKTGAFRGKYPSRESFGQYASAMSIDDTLLHRKREKIHDELEQARQDLREAIRNRRLAFVFGPIILSLIIGIEFFLIVMTVHNSTGVSGQVYFFAALVFGLISLGGVVAFFDETDVAPKLSRSAILRKQVAVQRLVIESREAAVGNLGREEEEAAYVRYREAMPDLIARLRARANRTRSINNVTQAFVIVASLTASAVTGLFGEDAKVRIAIVAVTLAAAIASSMGSSFKLRERAAQLQKTADLIEIEFRAVELQIGDYGNCVSRKERLRKFVIKVEGLRGDHMARERQLDQPADRNHIDLSSVVVERPPANP